MKKSKLKFIAAFLVMSCTFTACKAGEHTEPIKTEELKTEQSEAAPVMAESDYYQDERTIAYADYIAGNGVNIQKGEKVLIYAPTYTSEFVNLVVEACYKRGAGAVNTVYFDPDRIRIEEKHASQLTYSELVQSESLNYVLSASGADIAYLQIESPHFYEDEIDADSINKYQQGSAEFFNKVSSIIPTQMSNQTKWCVAACPNAEWAQKVYPELSTTEAVSTLWEDVLSFTYFKSSSDPATVNEKNDEINKKIEKLDSMDIQSLHFVGGETDLTVNLHQPYKFQGPEAATDSYTTLPNIPCAEIFTMPEKTGVSGHVATSRPLVLDDGTVIDKISMDFKDGYLTKWTCDSNEEAFEKITQVDGARYMGEISLVPADTPIYETDKVFYTTLLDENAACHFALGSTYADYNLPEGAKVDDEVNQSDTHVDFVFGTKDMSITATLKDGSTTELFKDGVWVLK